VGSRTGRPHLCAIALRCAGTEDRPYRTKMFTEKPLNLDQHIRDGTLRVVEVPDPVVRPNHLLVANCFSVISAGTEKMVIDLGKKSLLCKAKERPGQFRRVLEKLRNEGVLNTFSQVRERLDEPLPMRYSSAGVVLACGTGAQEFKPVDEKGDRLLFFTLTPTLFHRGRGGFDTKGTGTFLLLKNEPVPSREGGGEAAPRSKIGRCF